MTEYGKDLSHQDHNDLLDLTVEKTLLELANYYYLHKPEEGPDGFKIELFRPMQQDLSSNGDKVRDALFAYISSEKPMDNRFTAMIIACAYCIDVSRLLGQDKRERAWVAVSEARYWCGITQANRGVEAAREATIVASRRAVAKKGGDVRSARQDAVKKEAFRLAHALRPAEKGWRSRMQAANAIRDEVIKFSRRDGTTGLTDTGAFNTIYEWLAEMPDANVLFGKKKA
jgi:hypothetical protein